jgi:hypothetical protein
LQIDLERYRPVRSSLRVRGVILMVLGGMGLSFTGLFVLFGIHEVISPGPVHPDHNRSEGGGVLCVVSLPFAFCAWLVRRGFTLWRSASDFDRLITFAAKQPQAPRLQDAAASLSLDLERLHKRVTEGATRGFITDPSSPELRLSGAPAVMTLVDPPGRNPLFATLGGHAYGVLCLVVLALEKVASHGLILLVCTLGIPLTFVLHTLGVVGGVSGVRAARRAEPRGSTKRPLAALILGVLGYLAVFLLVFATTLELIYGRR